MRVGVLGSSGFLGKNLCELVYENDIDYVVGSKSI